MGKFYRDYSYFSGIIHNADIYTKTNWIDMTLLTKEYRFIKNDFYAACEVCLNYTEFDKSDF